MEDLLPALTTEITAALPVIAGVFGAIIGVVFLFAVGRFIIGRIRGAVK